MNENDIIREKILEYLFELNSNSRSPAKAARGIRDLQKELKEKYSYKQNQVASNLNYLIDRGWVNKETTENEFTAPGGTVVHNQIIKYRISADGIDYIEGPSRFMNDQNISNINIHNISGVVTVGHSNTIVNQQYVPLFDELEILHRKILNDKNIRDDEKLTISGDIVSLKSQLSKMKPDKSIVHKLWDSVKAAATISECIPLVTSISSLIHSLF